MGLRVCFPGLLVVVEYVSVTKYGHGEKGAVLVVGLVCELAGQLVGLLISL